MQILLFRKYLTIGAMAATFIGQMPPPEATPEAPVETGSIVVPSGIPYKTHRWSQQIPPPEGSPEAPVETGNLSVPLGIQYRGRSFTGTTVFTQDDAKTNKALQVRVPIQGYRGKTRIGPIPPLPIVVAEADELASARRSVYLPKSPYPGKTYIGQIPPVQPTDEPEVAVHSRRSVFNAIYPYRGKTYSQSKEPLTPDELLGRRAVYIPPETYVGKAFIGKTPLTEIVTDASAQKARFVSVPIGQRALSVLNFQLRLTNPESGTEVPDELVTSRRYVEKRPLPPYNYHGLSEYSKPDEVDELLTSRRVSFVPPNPYRSRIVTQGVPPPTTVEADELTAKRRAIFAPIYPYRDARYSQFRQPGEIDELLAGKRLVIVPKAMYSGKSVIVQPQTPEIVIVEADELLINRRRIFTPKVPYAPNLSRFPLIQLPEIVTVEAPELTVAKVRVQVSRLAYNWNLTRGIYRPLTLDELPAPFTIVGIGKREIADQLIAPLRTPIYVRKLAEHMVIIIKDNTPWSRYFSDLAKDALKRIRLTVTLDFPPTAPQSANDALVTVINVKVGDVVSLGIPPSAVLQNTSYFGFVSADDQVTIRFTNNDPILVQDPPEGEFTIIVERQ